MAFWNKDKSEQGPDSSGAQDAQAQSVPSGRKEKPKKKNEMMSSVLKESVVETVINDFQQNQAFIVERDGEELYVGLFFDTAAIGGLNRKSAKDEAKGSIIEAITSGRMKVLITEGLMDLDSMVVVPDSMTLDCMSEYSILSGLDYRLCLVDRDGGVETLEQTMTLQQAADVIISGGNVSMYLSDILGGAGAPEPEPSDEGAVPSDDGGFGDEMPFEGAPMGDEPVESSAPAAGEIPEPDGFVPPDDGGDIGWSGNDVQYEGGIFDEGEEQVYEEEPVEELPADMFEKAMTRRFYSDDLGMEVTTDPFDSAFLHSNPYVPFNENRGAGWINDYLNQMSRDANTDMSRVHQDNLFKMREKFFMLVSLYCEDIMKALDYTDPTTYYGKLYKMILDAKNEATDRLDRMVSDKKVLINDEWEHRLEEVAQSAAAAAMQQYRERHGRQHQDELYRIEPEIKEQIEDEFRDALRGMNDQRREEAARRLDLGVNEALKAVSEMYQGLLAEENARYKEYQDAMLLFMDENRKDEIARAKALSAELAQSEKADAVMAEYTAKIQQMTAGFEANRTALKAEIERLERKNERDLADKAAEYESRVNRLTDENETLKAQVDSLLGRIANLDAEKKAEYESRMDELIGEREAFSQKYDHLVDLQKNGRFFLVVFATVAVLAASVVGFVAGEYVGIKRDTGAAQGQILQELADQLQDPDFELPDGWDGTVTRDEDGNVHISISQDASQQESGAPSDGAQNGE